MNIISLGVEGSWWTEAHAVWVEAFALIGLGATGNLIARLDGGNYVISNLGNGFSISAITSRETIPNITSVKFEEIT